MTPDWFADFKLQQIQTQGGHAAVRVGGRPDGPALVLLNVIERNPGAVMEALQ